MSFSHKQVDRAFVFIAMLLFLVSMLPPSPLVAAQCKTIYHKKIADGVTYSQYLWNISKHSHRESCIHQIRVDTTKADVIPWGQKPYAIHPYGGSVFEGKA